MSPAGELGSPGAPAHAERDGVVERDAGAEGIERMARLLRFIGAALLIASAFTFMVQRWEQGNDLLRYALLLAHSAVLAAGAWLCGARARESRGARTFLAVLLCIVPTQMAVLGGLVYSQFGLDPLPAQLPQAVTWVAPSPMLAVVALAGSALCLTPLILVALTALVRAHALRLLGVYSAVNALLLIPARGSAFVGVIAAIGLVLLGEHELRWASDRPAMATPEGRIVRALLFAPVLLLVGRSVVLYEPGAALLGTLGIAAGMVVWRLGRRVTETKPATAAQCAGVVLAGAGWCHLASAIVPLMKEGCEVATVVYGYPIALILAVAATRLRSGRRGALAGATGIVILATLPAILLSDAAWINVLGLVAGIAILGYAAVAKRWGEGTAGAGIMVLSLVDHLRLSIIIERFSHWGALLVLGALVILAAAAFDRSRYRIAGWFARAGRNPR